MLIVFSLLLSNPLCSQKNYMACVGGNTISFANTKRFAQVISNELDPNRYNYLYHNVYNVMGLSQVQIYNQSIIDLVRNVKFDIFFLDPEW